MKLPFPDEAKVALEQTQSDMAGIRSELAEIKELLKILISVQYMLAGVDSPHDL